MLYEDNVDNLSIQQEYNNYYIKKILGEFGKPTKFMGLSMIMIR